MLGKRRSFALKFLALTGDILVFYIALFFSILIRYQEFSLLQFIEHLPAFSILLLAWIFFGYLSGIYELEQFINSRLFAFRLNRLLLVQALAMLALFYFLPFFSVSPRIIFLIFILFFSVLIYLWRAIFNGLACSKTKARRVILIGSSESAKKLAMQLEENPQFGLKIEEYIENPTIGKNFSFANADIIVSSGVHLKDTLFGRQISSEKLGLPVFSILTVYRSVLRFMPIEEFVHEADRHKAKDENGFYSMIKRFLEIILSGILIIVLSPLFLLIAIAIKVNSKGGVFYSQLRAGKHGKPFMLYKFRSMYSDLNINPDDSGAVPMWSSGQEDRRVTAVGKFLRSTHLDELPQLINILKGNMSFIGPRPERPEFDAKLIAQIPHYEMRYLLKPGVTGWAQINYPYVSSVDQARERFEHDLYYLYERSLLLDIRIILKTLRHFFVRN